MARQIATLNIAGIKIEAIKNIRYIAEFDSSLYAESVTGKNELLETNSSARLSVIIGAQIAERIYEQVYSGNAVEIQYSIPKPIMNKPQFLIGKFISHQHSTTTVGRFVEMIFNVREAIDGERV